MRIFLDTNVLVSAVAARGLSADVLQLVLAEHELVLGEHVLEELERVLTGKLGLPVALVDETVSFLRREATVVSDAPSLGIPVRDEDDVVVLEQAVAGEADVLVTGDRDLLEVASAAPLRVLSPRGFWEELRREGREG